MNKRAGKVAAVVPNATMVKSRYHKEGSGDAPVSSSGGWKSERLPENRTRGVVLGISYRIHDQISTAITRLKTTTIPSIRQARILRENFVGKDNVRTSLRDNVLLPSDGLR